MTALTTMDDLRDLTEGQHVKIGGVDGTEWVRVADGFRLANDEESYPVPFDQFHSPMASGQVETWNPREARIGQWWTYNHSQFFWMSHPRPDVDGQLVSLRLMIGGYLDWHNVSVSAFAEERNGYAPCTVEEAAGGLDLTVAWLNLLTAWANRQALENVAVAQAMETYHQRIIELERREIPERFVSQVHSVMGDFDDRDDTERLQGVLREWNVALTQEVEVTVRVNGTSEGPDQGTAEAIGLTTDWVDGVEVRWSNDLSITVSTTSADGCGCGEVTRGQVREALPESVRTDDWDWEVRTCDNH